MEKEGDEEVDELTEKRERELFRKGHKAVKAEQTPITIEQKETIPQGELHPLILAVSHSADEYRQFVQSNNNALALDEAMVPQMEKEIALLSLQLANAESDMLRRECCRAVLLRLKDSTKYLWSNEWCGLVLGELKLLDSLLLEEPELPFLQLVHGSLSSILYPFVSKSREVAMRLILFS